MSAATCPNRKLCHCGHLMSRSPISHMTTPAGPLTCLHVCTSQICLLHAFCSVLLDLPMIYLHEVRQRHRFFLPCCCFHLPPQLQPICGRNANLSVLTNFSLILLKDAIPPGTGKPHIALPPSRLLFCLQLLVLVLKSTPDVSSLVARPTPSLSFLLSLCDRQLQTSLLSRHQDLLCDSSRPSMKAAIASTKTFTTLGADTPSSLRSTRLALQYEAESGSILTQGGWPCWFGVAPQRNFQTEHASGALSTRIAHAESITHVIGSKSSSPAR